MAIFMEIFFAWGILKSHSKGKLKAKKKWVRPISQLLPVSHCQNSKGNLYLGLMKILTLTPPEQAKNYNK